MEGNPAIWFEIYVQDMERAKKFYEAVFEVSLEKLNTDLTMWAFPMNPNKVGAGGALVQMKGVESGGNSTIVYFHSSDCAKEAARIKQHGGKIEKEKMSIGQYGFIVLAYDTEGNMIGVHSME